MSLLKVRIQNGLPNIHFGHINSLVCITFCSISFHSFFATNLLLFNSLSYFFFCFIQIYCLIFIQFGILYIEMAQFNSSKFSYEQKKINLNAMGHPMTKCEMRSLIFRLKIKMQEKKRNFYNEMVPLIYDECLDVWLSVSQSVL